MQPVGVRLEAQDLERVDTLAHRTPFRRSALVRALVRLGLDVVEANPAALLRGESGPESAGVSA